MSFLDVHMSKIELMMNTVRCSVINSVENIEQLQEKADVDIQLMETWLERNVAAEGEVTILRERVDQQERTIQKLEKSLSDAIRLINMLGARDSK